MDEIERVWYHMNRFVVVFTIMQLRIFLSVVINGGL